MKITGRASVPANIRASLPPKSPVPILHSDLPPAKSTPKLHRRRTRLRRTAAPAGKRGSRPETPLLKWKTQEREKNVVSVEDGYEFQEPRRRGRQRENPVSARKLAAVLWRLSLPDAVADNGGGSGILRRGVDEQVISHVRVPSIGHQNGKLYGSEAKDLVHSSSSVSGTRNGFLKLEPSFKFSNSAMEGATKWDPVSLKNASSEAHEAFGHVKKPLDRKVGAASVISSLEAELEQARARILELETEQRHSKKKLEHFLKKVGEEKAAWRRREHEKIRAFINDVKSELNRERKSRQRLAIVNSKLVDDLTEAKLSAKRFLQDCEKERKTRELIEQVCDELAKEVGEDKAEVEAIMKESMKFREEVEDERKMLQMAEVWREERVQMKLVDAKVALEEKYSLMNKLVSDLENFLRLHNSNPDLLEAELLSQAAASVNIHEITDFHYEPGNPDDIFSVLEEMNNNEREMEACGSSYSPETASPEVARMIKKDRNSNKSDLEEDESGWETVSNLGSSFSPEGSAASVSEISDVGSSKAKQFKKVSSIARLWRSVPSNGDSYKVVTVDGGGILNGRARVSNGGIISPDRGSEQEEIMGQWSSPEMGNPNITRAMMGCIEWPRGSQRNSLKTKLLEARMESQKIQLRQVLKQKM